jgi:hypothetical protein
VPATRSYFRLIDPLRPPATDGEFGVLVPLVAEAVTWIFYDPTFDASKDEKRLEETPSLATVMDCIDAGWQLLHERRWVSRKPRAPASNLQPNDGVELVDVFCDRFIAKLPPFVLKTSSGRDVGQRQVLCAFALLYVERVAQGIHSGRSTDVCNSMRNLLELVCEIRRGLDREAGASVVARRTLKRWESRYPVYSKAIELFERRKWKSVRQARDAILVEVLEVAKKVGFNLTEGRAEVTIYEWLLAHDKAKQLTE